MLTQKVIGYKSTSTTLVTASGNCFAGLFCSGKLFRAIGISPEGICIEAGGQRHLVKKGKFTTLYLRVVNQDAGNCHQFYYSTDGHHFVPAGEPFPMHSGYWKGIRVGLFCYGTDGKAQFDCFRQQVQQ